MANGTPIVPTQSANVRSVVSKYTSPTSPTFARELSRATPSAIRGLASLDAQRLARGQRGYSQPKSAVALRAASTGESVVGEPNQGIIGNFARNAQEFTSALPKLPFALGKEVFELPMAGERIEQGLEEASNPIEALGNVASVPGVRMIPGAFVAEQFGTPGTTEWGSERGRGVEGLTTDPLFTALDVLPFASSAAGKTKVVRAATEATRLADEARVAAGGAATAPRVGRFSTLARYGRPGGPMARTADVAESLGIRQAPSPTPFDPSFNPARRGADIRTALEPNVVGRLIDKAGGQARGTKLGAFFSRAFGKEAMDATQVAARIDAELTNPRIASEANRPIIEARKQIDTARKAADLSESRAAEIHQALTRDSLDSINLSSAERAYVDSYRTIRDSLLDEALATEDLARVSFPHGEEILPRRQADEIAKARAAVSNAESLSRVADIADGSFTAPIDGSAFRALADSTLPSRDLKTASRGLIAELDARGYSVARLRENLRNARTVGEERAALRQIADEVDAGLPGATRTSPDDILRSVRPLARTDPGAARLVQAIQSGDYSSAAARARQLAKRKTFTGGLNLSQIADDLSAYSRRQRLGQSVATRGYDKALAKAQKRLTAIEQRSMPARFSEIAADRMQALTAERLLEAERQGLLTPDEQARVAGFLSDGLINKADLSPVARNIFLRTQREVRNSWMQMVDEGLDPEFVHRVSAGKAQNQALPRASIRPSEPGFVKNRVYDWGSTVNDVMVALDNQAAQMLLKRGSEEYVRIVDDLFGTTRNDLLSRYQEWAVAANRRRPNLTVAEHMDRLIERDWGKIDVPEIRTPDGQVIPAHESWVPRSVKETVDGLIPRDMNSVGAAFDPVLRVWRTALLPLSPRWHVYNVVGGAIMGTLEHGPGYWTKFRDGWDIARGKKPNTRRAELEAARGGAPLSAATDVRAYREAIQFGRGTDLRTPTGRAEAFWNASAGKWLRKVWDAEQMHKVRDLGGKALDASYYANELFDDAYRSTAYLYGLDKALTKGMTRAQAEAAGVAASRKVMQSWDRLTPVERSVIRNVFPFYSWAKFALGYATRFAFDHPWRMELMASIAQAELDDYGTGLPQQFMTLLDITGPASAIGLDDGDPDTRVMLNLEGLNPFRDMGSYATMLGFLSPGADRDLASLGPITAQMNPGIQTFLAAIGVDPSEGLPDPYANVTYNPSTGRLQTVSDYNLFTGLPQSILPQSKLLFDAAGLNRDYQRLLRSNPEAAKRRLLSSAGLPAAFIPRTFNPTQETIKAEVRRYEDLTRTRSEALRSGDVGALGRYDALKPLQQRIRDLTPAQRESLEPDRRTIEQQVEDAVAQGRGRPTRLSPISQ